MEIVLLAIGLVAGIVIGMLAGRSKSSVLAAKLDMTLEDNQRIKSESDAALSAMKNECAAQIEQQKTEHKEQIEAERRNKETELAKVKTELTLQFDRQIAELKQFHAKQIEEQKQAHLSAMQLQEERHREAVDAMQKLFDETMAKVTAQVKTATDDMLKQRQKEFAESSTANLGQIVNPLRDTITKMRETMNDNTLIWYG